MSRPRFPECPFWARSPVACVVSTVSRSSEGSSAGMYLPDSGGFVTGTINKQSRKTLQNDQNDSLRKCGEVALLAPKLAVDPYCCHSSPIEQETVEETGVASAAEAGRKL